MFGWASTSPTRTAPTLSPCYQPPSGITVALYSSPVENNRRDLDVLFNDAAIKTIDDDWQDHDTAAPYYENSRRPTDPLSTFYGAQAHGVWTLTLCDGWSVDAGMYYRSRLILDTDIPPQDTQASWRYAVPDVEGSDNQVYTSTLYAVDSVGNRTLTQTLTYHVDNVAPVITPTQVITSVVLTDTASVLQGVVSDGGERTWSCR